MVSVNVHKKHGQKWLANINTLIIIKLTESRKFIAEPEQDTLEQENKSV